MSDLRTVCFHESSHAVVSHRLGLRIDYVTVEGRHPHARVLSKRGGSLGQRMRTLAALATTDLAGMEAERCLCELDRGGRTDEENAIDRARRIVLLRHQLAPDAPLTPAMHCEVSALLVRARRLARELVQRHWSEIKRVAAALLARGTLVQGEIDALLRKPGVGFYDA
jgi:hypothetical protein